MKKIFLYATLLLGIFTFNACTEEDQEWADPQKYAQEDDKDALSAVVAPVVTSIKKADAEGLQQLLKTVSLPNAPEGSVLKFTKLMLGDKEIPFSTEDGNLFINPEDIDNIVADNFNSKRTIARILTLKADASVITPEGEAIPVDVTLENGETTFDVEYTPNALPAISEESAYYYIGGYNSWNLAEPTPMEDNGDGTFSAILTVGDNEYFCFAPQSAVDDQNWNSLFRAPSNGYTATSGFFNMESNNNNSFCCQKGGTYIFTISPKDWTYSYVPYSSTLWYSGDGNGWSFSPLAKVGDNFEGFYYIYKPDYKDYWGFKFETVDNWDDPKRVEFGSGGDDYTITSGGGNIELPDGYETGFYKISVNTDNLTYSLVPINVISIVGDAVGGWETPDYPLSYDTELRCWAAIYELSAGHIKFRANNDWAINWGGTTDALYQGGDNLYTEGGVFEIRLYPMCEGKGYVELIPQV